MIMPEHKRNSAPLRPGLAVIIQGCSWLKNETYMCVVFLWKTPSAMLPLTILLVAFASGTTGPIKQTEKKKKTWVLSWEDHFEGSSLNESIWNVRNNMSHCCGPFGGAGELQLYLPDEITVKDGKLHIRTRRRDATGSDKKPYHFTSGWIDTKGKWSQKFGRFEANVSLPSHKVEGIWPAFWLMPNNASQCWPTGGEVDRVVTLSVRMKVEVDIFEFLGNGIEDKIYGSFHWAEPGACGKDKAPIPGKGYRPHNAAKDWQRDFHIYAIEWWEDRIDFFLDGVKYFTRSSSNVLLPTSEMYVIFDQAVDSWLFPPSDKTDYGDGVFMTVEWVRVYT
eukprot:jgi/Bigna1/86222/estExt_fgenesh1_pg.C_90030